MGNSVTLIQKYFNSTFYALKPFISRKLQIRLRQVVVERKVKRFRHIWPIDKSSGKAPLCWPGWPNKKRFALVLTHDVDTARGMERCSAVAELEIGLGFRSSFNFVPQRYSVPKEIRQRLKELGFEIGVHGLYHDGKYFLSRSLFKRRAALINKYLREWNAVGYRSPSMLHNMEWIGDLDIEYDSSTFDTDPFEPQSDGVATIFPFLVPRSNGKPPFVELPYTLPQDFTLFVLMRHSDINIWKKKIEWIASCGGMVLVNTHPDYMSFNRGRLDIEEYPVNYYREFLEYVQTVYKGSFWHALPREVASYCRLACSIVEQPIRKKLRTCMLSYSFYESDNRVRRYTEALARRGDEIDVLSLRAKGQKKYSEALGVHIYRIQERARNERSQLDYLFRIGKFFLKAAFFITKNHIRKPYDLIHVHSVPDFLVFAAAIAKLGGAKVILDIHDILPEFYAVKFGFSVKQLPFKTMLVIERISANFADHVIISNDIWRKKLTMRSVNPKKCTTFLNYPDESIFYPRPRRRNDDRVIILYPGSMNRHQGLDIAIRAMKTLKEKAPNAELHIYGSGEEKPALMRLTAKLRLTDSVIFQGTVSIEKIPDIIADADVGLVPKRDDSFGGEAFSTKILEFMSIGVPVVCSGTKIDRLYFNEGVIRFFRPGDEKDLAGVLLQLIKDHQLRQQLSKKARDFAAAFCWGKHKQQYFDIVDGLIG